ncbi:hypothetical protein ICNINCKA_02965 [Synechococcus sp. CBW1107]|nr:hypothetical protein ICNINCKA_02965 [Synechococcus sp. CBW1107]
MHGGNHLSVSAGTAVSEWEAKSAQNRLIDENETRLFGLRRLDQSFPNVQALSVQTYDGIRSVSHSAQSDHEVFSWNDGEPRKLSVRLDRVENPDARFEDSAQKADSSTLLGAAVGALIGGLISGKPITTTEPAREGAPVSDLQSLVGAKGGQAEGTLTSKGYTYRGGTKLADSSFTYWEQPSTNNCVTIRTTDGRYQSITYTKKSDCN